MATKQQSQNAITLKGSAKLVMDYLSEHNIIPNNNIMIIITINLAYNVEL